MRNISLLLLCLLGAAFAVQKNVDYFRGRSANMIIQSANTVSEDSVLLLKGQSVSGEMQDTTFADLFSHVMGLPLFNTESTRAGFPKSNLFNTPKAALIVTVDAVGADTISQHAPLKFTQGAAATPLTTQSFPISTPTFLTNMVTGATPSSHGIVGQSWINAGGNQVTAYVGEEAQSVSANIADIFAQQYNGESLILSASASRTLSGVFAPHPDVAVYTKLWNVYHLGLNANNNFGNIYSGSAFDLDNSEVVFGSSTAGFDLSSNVDYALFAEVALARSIGKKLSANKLTKDNVPDLISFAFSSLKGIEAKYGSKSQQFATALSLVDDAIVELTNAVNAVYNDNVFVATILADTEVVVDEDMKLTIKNSDLKMIDKESFEAHYPAVYTHDVRGMCNKMKSSLQDVHVNCLDSNDAQYFERLGGVYDSPYADAPNPNTTVPLNTYDLVGTPDAVAIFWIFFFMTVIILSFVLWGVYNLCYSGYAASQDSLLFRVSGRHLHTN